MALRFVHLSDLHLGSRHPHLGEIAEERGREVLETFRDAIHFVLDSARRIDGVLISGNLFDRHRPDPETWAFVRGLLGRLVAAKKTIVIIPGARDGIGYKDSIWRTERCPGVDLITHATSSPPFEKEINGERVFFYGIGAQPGLTPAAFSGFERVPEDGTHIGLLHAALPDHAEAAIRPKDQSVDATVLADSGLDYVALGGFHGFSVHTFGSTTAAYAGTLEGRRFEVGDFGRKSLLVAEIAHGKVTLEQHAISRRSVEEWTIDLDAEAINDQESLVAAILARSHKDLIAKITLTGRLEFLADVDQVANSLKKHFCFLEVHDGTDLFGSRLVRKIESENTIRGFFVRRMLKRIDELLARAETAHAEAPVHRDLRVAKTAMRLGLEQFLELDAAPTPLFETSAKEATEHRRHHVAAPALAHAEKNGSPSPLPERARALARSERDDLNQSLADGSGEGL